ncbi:MAG: hypothetical protein WDW38_005378 [Sanguina aurantia]
MHNTGDSHALSVLYKALDASSLTLSAPGRSNSSVITSCHTVEHPPPLRILTADADTNEQPPARPQSGAHSRQGPKQQDTRAEATSQTSRDALTRAAPVSHPALSQQRERKDPETHGTDPPPLQPAGRNTQQRTTRTSNSPDSTLHSPLCHTAAACQDDAHAALSASTPAVPEPAAQTSTVSASLAVLAADPPTALSLPPSCSSTELDWLGSSVQTADLHTAALAVAGVKDGSGTPSAVPSLQVTEQALVQDAQQSALGPVTRQQQQQKGQAHDQQRLQPLMSTSRTGVTPLHKLAIPVPLNAASVTPSLLLQKPCRIITAASSGAPGPTGPSGLSEPDASLSPDTSGSPLLEGVGEHPPPSPSAAATAAGTAATAGAPAAPPSTTPVAATDKVMQQGAHRDSAGSPTDTLAPFPASQRQPSPDPATAYVPPRPRLQLPSRPSPPVPVLPQPHPAGRHLLLTLHALATARQRLTAAELQPLLQPWSGRLPSDLPPPAALRLLTLLSILIPAPDMHTRLPVTPRTRVPPTHTLHTSTQTAPQASHPTTAPPPTSHSSDSDPEHSSSAPILLATQGVTLEPQTHLQPSPRAPAPLHLLTDLDALLAPLLPLLPTLQPIRIVSALHALARLRHFPAGPAAPWLSESLRCLHIDINLTSSAALARLLAALAALDYAPGAGVAHVGHEAALLSLVAERMGPEWVVSALRSGSSVWPRTMSHLMDPRSARYGLWAAARCRSLNLGTEWLRALSGGVARHASLLTPLALEDLVMVVAAHEVALPGELMSGVWTQVHRRWPSMTAPSIIRMLTASARAGNTPPPGLLLRACSNAAAHAGTTGPSPLQHSAAQEATTPVASEQAPQQLPHTQQQQQQRQHASHHTQHSHPHRTAQQLGEHPCVVAPHTPPALQRRSANSGAWQGSAQPPHVARLLWACAAAGVDLPDPTLASLLAGLAPALPGLRSSDTTTAAWAVALLQLGHAPVLQPQRRQPQASPHDVTQGEASDPPELQPDEQGQQQDRKPGRCADPRIQHSLPDQAPQPHTPDLASVSSSSSSSSATTFLPTEAEPGSARHHATGPPMCEPAVPRHGGKPAVTARSGEEWGWRRQRQQSVQLFVRALLQSTPRLLGEGSPGDIARCCWAVVQLASGSGAEVPEGRRVQMAEALGCHAASMSPSVLSHYRWLESSRVRVIPRGIDPAEFPYGHRPDDGWTKAFFAEYPALVGAPLLTLPGRGTRLKGHANAIELLADLKRRGIEARLLLLGVIEPGREDYVAELRELVRVRGLTSQVVMTPTRNDIRDIYATSALVLQLSNKPESFGRTVIEALSLCRPVLGYAHGGVGELLAELYPAGRVPPGDRERLADRAAELLRVSPSIPPLHSYRLSDMQQAVLALYEEVVTA